jgi:hypothetical protein
MSVSNKKVRNLTMKETISRSKLYELVWSTPMTALAKKYLISDSGLRKICERMSVPLPKAGHWEKIKVGKSVEVVQLPTEYSGETEVSLDIREEGDNSTVSLSPLSELQKSIENDRSLSLIVPDRLSNPDKMIMEAKETLTAKRNYIHQGIVHSGAGQIDIRVSPGNVLRALRFMDTFIKAIKARGHEIKFRNRESYIVVSGEEMEIAFREKLKRVVIKNTWERTDYIPTGILSFRAKIWLQNTEWSDGKVPVEKQLAKIIAKLETRGKELRDEKLIREKERTIQELKEQKRRDLEKVKEKELLDFKSLLHKANRWKEAEFIRNYLNEVEKKPLQDEFKPLLREWVEWARRKADWYDPIIEADDELLKDVDREKLIFKNKSTFYYHD